MVTALRRRIPRRSLLVLYLGDDEAVHRAAARLGVDPVLVPDRWEG